MSSIPIPSVEDEDRAARQIMRGELSSPINPKPGCRFKNRCEYATEECGRVQPILEEIVPGHFVACHHVREINNL